ncbi:MAG TPA: hypothetical protein VFJ43_12315 [Bacteroidia bacterium]|nr:hypothetical protein [Bacteroidia bacterium]
MKPYIEVKGNKIYLPQSVDPHKYEVCMMEFGNDNFYLLCRKVSKRYLQATGVVMEHVGNELIFHKAGSVYVQRTFPLNRAEFAKINIDWQATSQSSVSHATEEVSSEE